MRGASLKDVQEFLGHNNISMTMRYAHFSHAHKKSAICLLDGRSKESSQKMDKMEELERKQAPTIFCKCLFSLVTRAGVEPTT
jgi:hypothetical protein